MAEHPAEQTPDDAETDDDIVAEARKRFARCEEAEASWRAKAKDDIKFYFADDTNLWQWPATVQAARGARPMLTLNKTRVHALHVINDARQNKTRVKISPSGGEATYEAAQTMQALVRHIEYQSNATSAYDAATWSQVVGGLGYWRVATDYAHDLTMDQEIYIRRVADPFSVYLDPDIREADGSDARFGFVFNDRPKADIRDAYPDLDTLGSLSFGPDDDWCGEDHVRECEYFRITTNPVELVALINGQVVKRDELDEDEEGNMLDPSGQFTAIMRRDGKEVTRTVKQSTVEHFLIVGNVIAERSTWPGRYIPLVRVPGEEVVVDGVLDRKGHVRPLRDAQRMYNYNSSAAIEYGALQTKVPWIASAESIEESQDTWDTANVVNHSVLTFKAYDENQKPLPRPERVMPPTGAPVFLQGMSTAAQEMNMASGQYEAELGAPSNERSGVAIQQRQRQSDTATYHFVERQAQAIRFTGRILLDLIPKIYDTPRILTVLAENGDEEHIAIDPNAPAAHQQVQTGPDQQTLQTVLNPQLGRYAVESDVGPDFATQREEAFNALSQLVQQHPQALNMIGDIWARSADFPLADEIAERLARAVPPNLKSDAPPPEVGQMQQQMQAMHAQMTAMQAQMQEREDKSARAWFDSETNRMKAIGGIDPQALLPIIREMVSQVLGQPAVPVMAAHAAADQAMQPGPQQPGNPGQVPSGAPSPAMAPPPGPAPMPNLPPPQMARPMPPLPAPPAPMQRAPSPMPMMPPRAIQ